MQYRNERRSRDDTWIVIAANSDNLWRRLAAAMGREALADDERFADHSARGAHRELLDEIIGAWAQEHDAGEIDAVLNAAWSAAPSTRSPTSSATRTSGRRR